MNVSHDTHGMLLVTKPDNIRNLGAVDILPALNLLEKMGPQLWLKENAAKENKFAVLGSTQHIVFRFTPANADPRNCYSKPAWHFWSSVLLPIIKCCVASYGYEAPALSKAMLAKMPAGGEIAPHYDGAGSNLTSHKVHVPLLTNPKALFQVNDDMFHLSAGQAYEVNNIVSHGAYNGGTADRIHFIFEHYDMAANPVSPDFPEQILI